MIELRKTAVFASWLDGVRDIRARARIQARLDRLAEGNPGDVKPIGEGVSELKSITVQGIAFISRREDER